VADPTLDADSGRVWPVVAARAAASKKAIDPVILEVGAVLAITDHFVIASATNVRQVRTIAEEVEDQVAAAGGPRPRQIEGLDDAHWVLVDYGAFVVHVFLDETRHYYELERLWSDVPRVDWDVDTAAVPGARGPSD
jgi:ribosome-associated protein